MTDPDGDVISRAIDAAFEATYPDQLGRGTVMYHKLRNALIEKLVAAEPPSAPTLEAWREEKAKAGGRDLFSGPFTIQDDLDNGGWKLYLDDAVKPPTLGAALSLADKLNAVFASPPSAPAPDNVTKTLEILERQANVIGEYDWDDSSSRAVLEAFWILRDVSAPMTDV